MSSTPEVRSLVLRDDLPAPEGFDSPLGDDATLIVVVSQDPVDELPVAAAVLVGGGDVAWKLDWLWVRPDLRRQGLGRTLLELVCARASAAGAVVLSVDVPQDSPGMGSLVAGTRLLGELMIKQLEGDPEVVDVVTYRPLGAAEFEPWQDAQMAAYAAENLDRYGGDLEQALARSRADFARLLPHGLDTQDTSLVVLTDRGERVAHLWLAHHVEPGVTFVFDVEVEAAHRGHGHGRAAMALAEALTRTAGDSSIALHVFGGNDVARRLYRTQGYAVRTSQHDLLTRDAP